MTDGTSDAQVRMAPAEKVTIGQVALLMHGAGKREAVKRLNACRGFDPAWPASFIFECGNALILIDQEAMRE